MVPWFVLGRLGPLLDQLWAPFGSCGILGLHLAILWGPPGDPRVSWGSSAFLWFPRGALGVPIGHPSASLWPPWPTLVAVRQLLHALKIESPTVPYSLLKQSVSVFFGIHMMILLIPAKWCCEVPLGAPLPHAPGVRMT